MEFLASIILTVILREVYAWIPNFSRWLVDRAICRMHPDIRARWTVELHLQLNSLPNTIYGLVHAFSIYFRVDRFNADFFEAKLDEIDKKFEEVSALRQSHRESLREAKLVHKNLRISRQDSNREIVEQLSSLKLSALPNRKPKMQKALKQTLSALKDLNDTMNQAFDRASHLSCLSIDSASVRLDQVDSSLKMISSKRDQVIKLLHHRELSPDKFELMGNIEDGLSEINSILKDDAWGDDEAMAACDKIMDAIADATAQMKALVK